MKIGMLMAFFAAKIQNLALADLWTALRDLFTIDESQYENLWKGSGGSISVVGVIVGLCVGITLACIGAVFNKQVLGRFVRRLLKENCLSPEDAKTLAELRYADKLWIRRAVKNDPSLRRVVRCREEERFYEEQRKLEEEHEAKRKEDPSLPKFKPQIFRIDANEHHFYIPEALKYTADVKFEGKGSTWPAAVATVIIMGIIMLLILAVLPNILDLLNDLLASAGNNNVVT